MNIKSLFFFMAFLLSIPAYAVTDYLGISKIDFLGSEYKLVWSAGLRNGDVIEDFIPKGPSYTQFEKKLSVHYMKNTSFEKVFMEKQNELEVGKQEGQVIEFKSSVLNRDEIVCSYTSELLQDGVTLVVQYSSFRYIRKGSDVIVVEWQNRAYKDAENFKERIEKNKDKWMDAFVKFNYNILNYK